MEENCTKKGSFGCFIEAFQLFLKSFSISLKMYTPCFLYMVSSVVLIYGIVFLAVVLMSGYVLPLKIILAGTVFLFIILALCGIIQYFRGMSAMSLFAKDIFKNDKIKPFKEYFDKAGSFLQILCLILWSFLGVAVSVLILSFIMYPFSLFGIGGKIISFLLIIAGLIFIYNVSSLIFINQAHRNINVSSREVFFETIKESFKNFFSLCAYIFYISIPVIIIAIITAIAVFSLYGNEAGHILKDVIEPAVNILVQPFIYYYYCFMLTKFYLDFIKKEGGI